MKSRNRRKAISQSLDLFIIIAAVLAVGGVTFAAATGLIGSSSQSATLTLSSSAIAVGTSGSSLALQLKDVGTQSLSGTATITILGVNGVAGATCTSTGSVTWTGSCTTTTSPVSFTASGVTLAPGAALSISSQVTGITFTSGSQYVITVSLAASSATFKVTAQ